MAKELTKKEKYLINFFKLDENTVRSISEIGRIVGTNKYNVWIAKEIKKNPELINNNQDIQYVIDWASKKNPNINELSFEQAMQQSTDWHNNLKFDETVTNKSIEEEDGNIVYRCRDKKHYFMVLQPEELNQEGQIMRNCVGTYTEKVRNRKSLIVSLRDNSGESHVTIEIDIQTGMVIQVRGKANGEPAPKYQKLMTEFAIFASGNEDNLDKELLELMNLSFD